MSNLFDSENRRIIETLNASLGTKHRTKPYNLNNPSDLKHALMIVNGAYRDYWHYKRELMGVSENFDESLKHYDTISWINQGIESEKVDDVAENCAHTVGVAIDAFEKIEPRAREYFIKTLAIALSAPPEVQRAALGRPYYVSDENMEDEIEQLLEILDEAEYQHSIPSNFKILLELMADEWAKGK